jgi:hypothetical protein
MILQPDNSHNAYLDALKAALITVPDMPVDQIMAIAAQYVGMLLAMQDMRKMTAQQGLELIMRNIETGNQTAIMCAPTAGRA